ncbi:class C beta-lactamase-related serine hydrolase [Pontibacter diazotrophicus]|uniref:Class C beta-lactamase-related serine hydrolase n=1 Tax=Pontibacter diazotrophicus TaxID=1400979 RepID=A0A3D8L7E4_9BACT|nr:serine hydrolase [Pontibacter diazotrophicus]RDV13216.1 class C beta-lactamase-related serine hydrolase [Pontibacter diazotrophicus]
MSRKGRRYGFGALLLLVLFAAWVHMADKNYVYRAIYYNLADIDDNTIFEQREIEAPPMAQPWPLAVDYNKLSSPAELERLHEELRSVAFLIVQHDSILFEQYWDGYSDESLSNSFSMAKSIVSMLVGIAIKEGKIESVEQPVGDFLPEFREGDKSKIRIRHLLWMSSGLNWDESYINPFSMTTESYYGTNLRKVIDRLEAVEEPGRQYTYKSGDTQVLGFVLQAATGKSLSAFAEEKLWKPIGAAHDAEWSVDTPEGIEKAYCCFFSNARDFARLGRLYLHNGLWNGDTLIPPAYVEASLTPNGLPKAKDGKKVNFYGYHWWLMPDYKGQDVFYARGILGQYIIVIPEKDLVIVRLGKERDEVVGNHPNDVKVIIDAVNKMLSSTQA